MSNAVLAPPQGPMSVAAGKFSLDFLQRWCLSRSDEGANELGVAHFVEGGTGHEFLLIKTVREKDATKRTEEVANIAEEFMSTVYEHVGTHKTPQRYGIIAFHQKQPRGQHQFMLAPPISNQIGGESEPANVTGALAMALRHQEAMTRTYLMGQHQLFERFDRMLERATQRQSQLEDKHADTLRYQQELIDRTLERQIMLEEKKFEQEVTQRLFMRLESFLPALIAKHTGVEVPQLPTGTPTPTVAEFFKTLEPERQEQIRSSMPEDVRADFDRLVERNAPGVDWIFLFKRLDEPAQKAVEACMTAEQSDKLAALIKTEVAKTMMGG